MMGYTGGELADFGKGTLPILVGEVRCFGNETTLDACDYSTDAGARACSGGYYSPMDMDGGGPVGVKCQSEWACCWCCGFRVVGGDGGDGGDGGVQRFWG